MKTEHLKAVVVIAALLVLIQISCSSPPESMSNEKSGNYASAKIVDLQTGKEIPVKVELDQSGKPRMYEINLPAPSQELQAMGASLYMGTVLEVSEDSVRVKVMNSIYKFPIQRETKIVDKHGRNISISQFRKGDAVTVTATDDKVIEIRGTKGP